MFSPPSQLERRACRPAPGVIAVFVAAWLAICGAILGQSPAGPRVAVVSGAAEPWDIVVRGLGPEFRVSRQSGILQDAQTVTSNGNDRFVAVWESFDSRTSNVEARQIDLRGPTLRKQIQVNPGPDDCVEPPQARFPAVGGSPNGDFAVAWMSHSLCDASPFDWSIDVRRFNAAGDATGAPLQVDDSSGSAEKPQLAMDTSGAFVVVWESHTKSQTDGAAANVMARRSDSAGNFLGEPFQINSTTLNAELFPVVAMTDQAFVVAWESDDPGTLSTVQAQRYDASGVPIGRQFQVSIPLSSPCGDSGQPAIGSDSRGNFVVAWAYVECQGPGGILAQRFDPSGVAVGPPILITAGIPNGQGAARPRLAVAANGDFVVTWGAYRISGGTIILERRYDHAGRPETKKPIRLSPLGLQLSPDVAMDTRENILFIWPNGVTDGTIVARAIGN